MPKLIEASERLALVGSTRLVASCRIIVIKNLILRVLKSSAFRYSNEYYKKITGKAMGTIMTLNYANLFMGNFEENVLLNFFEKTCISSLLWLWFIDDVFI